MGHTHYLNNQPLLLHCVDEPVVSDSQPVRPLTTHYLSCSVREWIFPQGFRNACHSRDGLAWQSPQFFLGAALPVQTIGGHPP